MARKKLDLSKLQTDTSQVKSAENTSNYKKECEFGVIDGFKPMPREQLAYNYIFRLCTDKTGVLSSVEDCQRIITALEHLASIVVPDELEEKKELIKICEDKIKVFEDKVTIETYTNYIKVFTLDLVFKVNQVCLIVLEKSQPNPVKYSELKPLVETNNIELKIDFSEVTNFETIKADISDILENLNRVFPEFKIPEKPKKGKPSNKAYKLKNIESSPNHSTALDILSLVIKPQEFSDKSDFYAYQVNHKGKKFNSYTRLEIPTTETIGTETIDIGEATLTVVKCFDWKDRKILRLLFTEALQHRGEFSISGKWILKMIGDDRSSVRVNRKRLSAKEKLEDLRRRLIKYDSVRIHWSYNLGKNKFSNIPDGTPLEIDFKILKVNDLAITKDGRGNDLITTISLGSWFSLNRNFLQEFTRIPKNLFNIDTSKNWRAFALGEKICVLTRINKEKILKNHSPYRVPIKLKIKTLLDDILNPLELKLALQNAVKGTRLKQRIIEDTEYLSNLLNWRFDWHGLKGGDNFNTFYNSASFTVILDGELEAEILGEKIVKPIKIKSSQIPVTIDGYLVKALRKKLGLTQSVFAKYLGYDRTYISKIERGSEIASPEFTKNIYKKYAEHIKELHIKM